LFGAQGTEPHLAYATGSCSNDSIIRPGADNCCGIVAPGFEHVAQEFRRNFSERGELGAAFAATRDDRLVVDLWGGVADPGISRRWQSDTL
jgi:Beta-lactamase